MKKMLENIKSKGMIHWSEIHQNYYDIGTITALMNRILVKRDLSENYYILTNFSDEQVESYINLHKIKKDKNERP